MPQPRRASSPLRWLLPLVGCVLVACGVPATPTALPPTTAVRSGHDAPQPQQLAPTSPRKVDGPRCVTEAKDPATGEGLTDADCAKATRLAQADPRFQQLLDGLSYQPTMVVLWHRDGGGLIGAVVMPELAEPISLNGEWLATVNDCTPGASPPYQSILYRQAGTNVSEIMVSVDLTRHQVVGVSPARDPTHQWTPVGPLIWSEKQPGHPGPVQETDYTLVRDTIIKPVGIAEEPGRVPGSTEHSSEILSSMIYIGGR